jgi:hypothetical protein
MIEGAGIVAQPKKPKGEPWPTFSAFQETANDQPAEPAEVGIPATIEPRSAGCQPFDWGTADKWIAKYRHPWQIRSKAVSWPNG